MLMSTKQKVSDTAIDRLPSTLPLASRRERVRVSSFGGLDMGAGKAWGIADMSNLSPRRAPSLATRPPQGESTMAWSLWQGICT